MYRNYILPSILLFSGGGLCIQVSEIEIESWREEHLSVTAMRVSKKEEASKKKLAKDKRVKMKQPLELFYLKGFAQI